MYLAVATSISLADPNCLHKLDSPPKYHERKMPVTCSFEKVTLALHNDLPLCCLHIVLASLV